MSIASWTQEFRDAWWDAEKEEGLRQLTDALDAPSAWLPAHLAWDASVPDDWDDVGGGSERRCALESGGTEPGTPARAFHTHI